MSKGSILIVSKDGQVVVKTIGNLSRREKLKALMLVLEDYVTDEIEEK